MKTDHCRPQTRPLLLFGALLATLATACTQGAPPPTPDAPFDVLLTNARVVDGAGNPWFRADIGLRGDRIAAVGRSGGARGPSNH